MQKTDGLSCRFSMASASAIPTPSSFSISFRGHRHGHLLLQAPHHPGPPHRHRPLPPPLPPQRARRPRPPRPPLPTHLLLSSFHHLRQLRASCHRSPPTLPKPAPIPQHHNHHHPLRRHVSSPRSHQQDRVLEQREGTDRILSRCVDRRGRIQVLFIWARFRSLICFEKSVLCIDIDGGSTEFVVGKSGNVVLSCSLNLGHVNLSQREFGECSGMREYI